MTDLVSTQKAVATKKPKNELAITALIQKESLPELFGERENETPKVLFLIEQIENVSRSIAFDVTTKEGKATCRSLATKIANAKNALDKAGKHKKDQHTVFTQRIDEDRRLARERLQTLQDEVRLPLTKIEEREKARIASLQERVAEITSIPFDDLLTSEQVQKYLDKLAQIVVDDSFQEYLDEASMKKQIAMNKLNSLRENYLNAELAKQEADRVAKEREQQERLMREEQIAIEAAENARKQAILDQQRREQELLQQQQRREQELQRQAIERENALRKEIEMQQAAERQRQALEQAQIAQQQALAENKAHRHAVFFDVKDSFVREGFDEETAKRLVHLIHGGKISHVTINF